MAWLWPFSARVEYQQPLLHTQPSAQGPTEELKTTKELQAWAVSLGLWDASILERLDVCKQAWSKARIEWESLYDNRFFFRVFASSCENQRLEKLKLQFSQLADDHAALSAERKEHCDAYVDYSKALSATEADTVLHANDAFDPLDEDPQQSAFGAESVEIRGLSHCGVVLEDQTLTPNAAEVRHA
mmetsp:Transcript_16571/g.28417  ORF Transcript_16571/g.28417 Transcript_16571/m.28417 type:complete len:186 (+) Transcript_16571:147-704(+)|eukprot:CAMPEP_0119102700 /NCGR_PEP_ID=MMETSP1180-20130426/1351_1 /TAXON_ID=3052 ORGANISM="Chlamydomonas cf sp, Strain CCMP681" /NCGR_SAMPLE_ID=MMETSP1180 /ASSEMBLY_ACC=CAM_ASM_000741 /LENGTH=185 /DNA_ID=CAMNT_0007087027 /DNA_START=144 /DNA_END=701 /DNA_ORIENTATION=-